MDTEFTTAISRHVWETKYRHRDGVTTHDITLSDTWRRVARALAAVEPVDGASWEWRFYRILEDFRFLPGGRILAGAGTARRVTLFNCFVMDHIRDSIDDIFDALKEGALTMQQGGGVGYDFSTLRPRGARAYGVGSIASGPVSFMRVWDAMCATLLSTGARRGAMMATLRCDHPDIEDFVTAKQRPGELSHFNLSVLASDDFMRAVADDADWPLVFPAAALAADGAGETVLRRWSGEAAAVPCRVLRRVRARALWEIIMRATYDHAEPGVLFVDRINRLNNLRYREHISATNPCGEIPLPPYGACDLGSLNLARFVIDPFTPEARLDEDGLRETAAVAVRLLDDVIDASRFPLPQQAAQARGTRRIGLGLTGLADALIMLGLHYSDDRARELAAAAMRIICYTAYRTSIALAREKGAFPYFDKKHYPRSAFVATLPDDIRAGIAADGLRNSHLTAIAPTGTISLFANNVSSGLEPVYDFRYHRRVLEGDGSYGEYQLDDYAYALWRRTYGAAPLPPQFVTTQQLAPRDHLAMQAALQPYVDNSISKTVNVPADFDYEEFKHIYAIAYRDGLKGCTTFRPNPVTGSILAASGGAGDAAPHCCNVEREAD